MFVHLHCHSHYSFLRGVASPEEIIAAAAEQKMPAVALTDTNGLYAAVPFYQAAKKAGIKPIVGVTLGVEWPLSRREIPRLRAPTGSEPSARNDNFKSMPLVLLAADMEGYSNLCQLVTLRHLGTAQLAQNTASDHGDGRPVTLQELAEHSRGVIALAPTNHLQLRSFPAGPEPSVASLRMTNEKKKAGGASPASTKTRENDADCHEQGISATSHQSPACPEWSRRVTSHESPVVSG